VSNENSVMAISSPPTLKIRSRYSDWLRSGLRRVRGSSPGRVKNLTHVVQTGSVALTLGALSPRPEANYGLDDRGAGVRVPVGSRIFIAPYIPDRLWGRTRPSI
jgi:hypothetical protein